ncbi:MAG: hypothetical protein QM784_22505 [Polyangiaceae bacterium]
MLWIVGGVEGAKPVLRQTMSQKDMPSESDLEQVVRELRVIHQRSGISAVAEVGKLVLDRFFGGSISAWQSGHRNKERSLRRLARCEGCPYSKSALHQAIRIHLVRLANPTVQTYEHIGPSHIVVTLALDESRRATLLRIAEEKRWSVRRLRQEVERWEAERFEAERSEAGPGAAAARRGRPRGARTERVVVAVRQATKQVELMLLGNNDTSDDALELHEIQQTLQLLQLLEEQCQRLSRVQASLADDTSLARTAGNQSAFERLPSIAVEESRSRRGRLARTTHSPLTQLCVSSG